MKKYENPEVEVISLDNTDVILTSFTSEEVGTDENTGNNGGFAKPTSILDK